MDEVTPFARYLTERGGREFRNALDWLAGYSEETAHRFRVRFAEEIAALCVSVAEQIARHGKPFVAPQEQASLHFSKPIYRFSLETAKTRGRRSSAGLWCGASSPFRKAHYFARTRRARFWRAVK